MAQLSERRMRELNVGSKPVTRDDAFYLIIKVLHDTLGDTLPDFFLYEALGVLEAAKLELFRRMSK